MEESMGKLEVACCTGVSSLAQATNDALALGSLVAALSEETEDDFELDLRVRAWIESEGLRFISDSRPENIHLEN